jgi:diacylglycerol kinase (ATP)
MRRYFFCCSARLGQSFSLRLQVFVARSSWHAMGSTRQPLHFLINARSGGGLGNTLKTALERVVGAQAVHVLGAHTLSDLVAQPALRQVTWVACGGDGTVSALAGALKNAAVDASIGVIPLGTGNDLARSCGWGSGWKQADCTDKTVTAVAEQLAQASSTVVDYWCVRGPKLDCGMLNYCSFGGDAAVALAFHHTRQRYPRLVRGQLVNKSLYAVLGAGQRPIPLAQRVQWDGEPLPGWAHALVVSNISSYAGGVRLARKTSNNDGFFEVVALGAGIPLGLVTAGARRPRLLARRAEMSVRLHQALPMQIDGEPFMAQAGTYTITMSGQVRLLVASSSSATRVSPAPLK